MPSSAPKNHARPNILAVLELIILWIRLSPTDRLAVITRHPEQQHRAYRTIRRRLATAVYIAFSGFVAQLIYTGLPDHQLSIYLAIGAAAVLSTINLTLTVLGINLLHKRHGRASNA